jgi:tetratricopeptide (TPR) repeat protein
LAKAAKSLASKEAQGVRKLAQALAAGKKGDYARAAGILEDLISESDAPGEAWLLLGRSFHALREYSRALAAFNDFIRQRPSSADGYLFAGRTYLALGMPYRAVPLLRKALEKQGLSSKKTADVKALLGAAYLRSKHSGEAVQTLEEAVEAAPANKRVYRAYLNSLLIRGVRLCGADNYELGLQMLRFVLENGAEYGLSDSTFLRLHLGRAARETGNLTEALDHFTSALKLSAKAGIADRRIRWSRASILMALGKNTEARQEIEKIRSGDEGVPELPWNSELVDLFMIRSFLESGEWRQAASLCRDWLRFRDDRPIIHVLYAEALRNLRRYEAAGNHLKRALEKSPKELDFWYAAILVSWEGRDYVYLKRALRAVKSLGGDQDTIRRFTILCEARSSENKAGTIAMLQDAIRSLGPEPELMYALGEAYLQTGLLEEAASWFKKTISLKKDHESAWLGGIAALEAINSDADSKSSKNDSGDLETLYRAYLEKWPDNSGIRRDRAMFLIKTFEYAEAASELEKLLVWEPSNPSLRRVLAYAYRKTGRYREAALFLKSLLREKPKDIGVLIEYSGCLERSGAASYALAVLEKARELFKKSSDISLALGVLNFRQKETEKAFDYLREAAALNPGDARPREWMEIIAKKSGTDSSYRENEEKKRKNTKKT